MSRRLRRNSISFSRLRAVLAIGMTEEARIARVVRVTSISIKVKPFFLCQRPAMTASFYGLNICVYPRDGGRRGDMVSGADSCLFPGPIPAAHLILLRGPCGC